MRIGSEDKLKVRLMIFLLITAALLAVYRLPSSSSEPETTVPSARSAVHREIALTAPLELNSIVAEQNPYNFGKRNIFQFLSTAVEKKPSTTPQPPGPSSKLSDPLPQIPLKFYGFARKHHGVDWIFLQDDQEIFVARPGDTVERRYQVLEVKENSAVILDLLNNNRETIPLIQR